MYRLDRKNREIGDMFTEIAPRYDFLNRLLSAGIDRRWRRAAVAATVPPVGGRYLDVATGTADVALEIFRQKGKDARVVGADISEGMLRLGALKARRVGLSDRLSFVLCPGESLPFRDGSFDSVTIAFGIRNVVDRPRALREMWRVTKKGGRLVVLEFSLPRRKLVASIYNLYFNRLLPLVGGLFSRRSAYRYLPDSVGAFPPPEEFSRMMGEAGCSSVEARPLTLGIATLYVGKR